MSRGNLILLGALAVAVGLWLIGRDWATNKPTAPSARLFPDLNREGADRIDISGGATGTTWAVARSGSEWVLASAGGYPVKRAEVDRFLDAVSSLRRDNPVGKSADMRAQTRTDEKNGRLVRVLKGEEPLAEFYVGKQPKQGYQEFFIRKTGDDTVYRTTTLLAKETPLGDTPASGFDWDSYTGEQSRKWVDPEIWDLAGAEAEELWLSRPGLYDAKLVKQAQDKWDVVEEGKEPVPADADVADGILSVVRRLTLYEVLGSYADVAKEYGLDAPEVTLVMKLRKKVAKPEPKEGEAKEGEEKKEEEYKVLHRTVEIGKKVSRERYDSYSDSMKSEDFYAIHVGPGKDMDNPDEAKRADYVFLVRDYTASQLRKELTDLHAKPKEEEKGAGPLEGALPGEAKPSDEKKPAEETKPAGETKPTDEAKPAEETKPADEKKPADEEKPPEETEKPKGEGEEPKGEGEGAGG